MMATPANPLAHTLLDTVEAAAAVLAFHGYLTTEESNHKLEGQGRFEKLRNRAAYDLLRIQKDAAAAEALMDEELDRLTSDGHDDWNAAVETAREELRQRIHGEAKKSPRLRRAIRWAPAALLVALGLVYFGVRLFSGVTLDQPLETVAGFQQRAAAAERVIRYDGWMATDTRRGGWVKALLLWPIEPSGEEVEAATEFVSVVLGAYQQMQADGALCGALPDPDSGASEELVTLVSEVAASVRAAQADAPAQLVPAIENPIKARFPC